MHKKPKILRVIGLATVITIGMTLIAFATFPTLESVVQRIDGDIADGDPEENGGVEDQNLSPPNLSLPLVTVVPPRSDTVRATVRAFGLTQAHFRQSLVAEVSGRIIDISLDLESGSVVRKGDVLAKIEDTSYLQAVAEQKAQLASSQLSFMQEKQRNAQARADWERANIGEPASALALRKPFLETERLKVGAAKSALQVAELNLAKTSIVAPFDAIVISRSATPGAFVGVGSVLAEIYSIDMLRVDVALSSEQLKLLFPAGVSGGALESVSATVTDDIDRSWPAEVRGLGALVDDATRQQMLQLMISLPNEGPTTLLPGSFVSVELQGPVLPDALLVPSSAITVNGYLWTVDADSRLRRFAVAPVMTEGEESVIQSENLSRVFGSHIVVNPLATYLPGMQVTTRTLASRKTLEANYAE